MKLHGDITINNRVYRAGTDVPWFAIYPFFLIHAEVAYVVLSLAICSASWFAGRRS